jgi:ADP-heptose:LPS heptosyltransferase
MDDNARAHRMKILVVSLLRLGDILLSTTVLRSLKIQYPKAEIHILINGQFANVADMIPYVNKVYSFDRDGIQKIIGSQERNLLEAYFRIEDLVEQLQTERYQKVINLTHNRLSGWLTALIGCTDTKGVMFGNQGKFSVGSEWFDYLNDFVSEGRANVFHFVDVFHYGAGLTSRDRRIELQETELGKAFAEKVLNPLGQKTVIAIQPFSAEEKKTFSHLKWAEIIRTLKRLDPNLEVLVLGSKNEQESAMVICTASKAVPVICDLNEAFSVLNRVHLLISGDTSIKHLAAAVSKLKILEISIGSSEYLKTGAYKDGAIIIQGLVECAPCSHSTPCTQKTHECADKISAELVAMSASTMLRHDEAGLRMLAFEDREAVTIARTIINQNGDWSAYPLGQKMSAHEINTWIDRTSFKLYLQGVHKQKIGEYGTESVQLKNLLENIFPDQSKQDWSTELVNLEKEFEWFELQVEGFLDRLKKLLSHYSNEAGLQTYVGELEEFCTQAAKSHFSTYGLQISWSLKEIQIQENPFEVIKRMREKLSNAHQRTKIELKLIRGLKNQFKEAL